ncbi:MAG: NAD(P)H-dependent oxidoreductase [Bacteroidota bacterium]
MKKLVIITHPDLDNSQVNKTWMEELKNHPQSFELHALYQKYPDLNFDIMAEQQLLSSYDEIIFQFPMHWFSTPFALKKYVDEVFTYGWAFGPEGDKMKGKKIGFAVSTGGPAESYDATSGIPVASLLNDFSLSFQYCGCEISQLHVLHGAMEVSSTGILQENAQAYVNTFLA